MKNRITIDSENYHGFGYVEPYIRYCAEDYYSKEWELKKRKISDYELLYITAGEGEFIIEDRLYQVKKNDVILFKPSLQHSGKATQKPFGFLCAHFDIFASKYVNAAHHDDGWYSEPIPSKPVKYYKAIIDFPEHVVLKESSNVNGLFSRVINEYKKAEQGYRTLSKSIFTELIFSLFRQTKDIGRQKEYNAEITSIINYISSNYTNKIHLSDISECVHLHPSYLCSLFKKHTGVTLSEYIVIFRISMAKKLLLEKNGKISEIAYDTGFYDVHHFTRVFKKYEGLTPGEYKKINYL